MLREFRHVRQEEGHPHRRWFGDEYFDLIVWEGDDGSVIGFQLCYDKGRDEHALTWKRDGGASHRRVDDGEGNLDFRKQTPVLVPDGHFAAELVSERFRSAATEIDPDIAELVATTLIEAVPLS